MLLDRVKYKTSQTNLAGALTVDGALVGYDTPALAGAVSGASYSVVVEDANGVFVTGVATYNSSGTPSFTLSTQLRNPMGTTTLSGAATVMISPLAANYDVAKSTTLNVADYYSTTNNTDALALQACFNDISSRGALFDCTIAFRAGGGLGPNGVYLIDREVRYAPALGVRASKIIMDFAGAKLRFTTAASCIRYSAPAGSPGSTAVWGDYFELRDGFFQCAANVVKMFYWDFDYVAARIPSTGAIRNCRFFPQATANTAHKWQDAVWFRNTWDMHVTDCSVSNVSLTPAQMVSETTSFIRTLDIAIVTVVTRCQVWYVDAVVRFGYTQYLSLSGTFSQSFEPIPRILVSTDGNAYQYKFVRRDTHDGTHVYDLAPLNGGPVAAGTYASGTVFNVLEVDGVTNLGTFTTSNASGLVNQPPEALQIADGCAFVSVNYAVYSNMPLAFSGNNVQIDTTMSDSHTAFQKSVAYLRNSGTTTIGSGCTFQPLVANTTAFDISNSNNLIMKGFNVVTNGNAGVTFLAADNLTNFLIDGVLLDGVASFLKFGQNVTNGTISNNVGRNTGRGWIQSPLWRPRYKSGLSFINNPTICPIWDTEVVNGFNSRIEGFASAGNGLSLYGTVAPSFNGTPSYYTAAAPDGLYIDSAPGVIIAGASASAGSAGWNHGQAHYLGYAFKISSRFYIRYAVGYSGITNNAFFGLADYNGSYTAQTKASAWSSPTNMVGFVVDSDSNYFKAICSSAASGSRVAVTTTMQANLLKTYEVNILSDGAGVVCLQITCLEDQTSWFADFGDSPTGSYGITLATPALNTALYPIFGVGTASGNSNGAPNLAISSYSAIRNDA